jgi:hypothetical protein
MTTAQDGGKFISLTHRPPLPPGNNCLVIMLNNRVLHVDINPSNAELNPICHLLALLGAHHILHFSRIRVKIGGAYGSFFV